MKQTAVEWLQQALEDTILTHEQIMQTIGLFEQAKDIDAERAYNTYEKWFWDNLPSKSSSEGKLSQKEFYNRYFKMKQTAVEWLRDLYENQPAYDESILDEQWQKAIEMEKEMIIETSKNSYIAGYLDNQAKVDDSSNFPEDYYNETFKTNEK
jgi:hypothetical protein